MSAVYSPSLKSTLGKFKQEKDNRKEKKGDIVRDSWSGRHSGSGTTVHCWKFHQDGAACRNNLKANTFFHYYPI